MNQINLVYNDNIDLTEDSKEEFLQLLQTRIICVTKNRLSSKNCSYYLDALLEIAGQVVPSNILDCNLNDKDELEDRRDYFRMLLPLITIQAGGEGQLLFYGVYKARPGALKFLLEMMNRWLFPGKKVNIESMFVIDFRIEGFEDDIYSGCHFLIRVEETACLEEINQSLPRILAEIRLGVESGYHARRILEIKGLTPDEKTAMIHENIAHLAKRLPYHFGDDVFAEMQHVLVMCLEEFKAARSVWHLSRIISTKYLFRKSIRQRVKEKPEQRHLSLRLFPAKLKHSNYTRSVLGVVIGLNFLKENELFEERHILKAINNYLPQVRVVENSVFHLNRKTDKIATIYLEIEKNNGEDFTKNEVRILKEELPFDLKDRVEHLMHPVFMPRNEEEIMRNILSLSMQIKFISDLPQVFITFDEQTHSNLIFTVIAVRIVKPGSLSIQELFEQKLTSLTYIPDRCKTVGLLRKKYAKEATVFRVRVSNQEFLRDDNTIDLNKARQKIASELNLVIGEYRDYNGGMITKQNEMLIALRKYLQGREKFNELVLEKFFYSLMPTDLRTTLAVDILGTLFIFLSDVVEGVFFKNDEKDFYYQTMNEQLYFAIYTRDQTLKEEANRLIQKMVVEPIRIVQAVVTENEMPCCGYIFFNADKEQRERFIKAFQELLLSKKSNKKTSKFTQLKLFN